MSMLEGCFCWSACCDLGPHECICGNDCPRPRGDGTITHERHLAEHWPTVHTRAGLHWSHMYQCKCGWMPPQDDSRPIEDIHAEHVAATWREVRTVRTVEELDAIKGGAILIDAKGCFVQTPYRFMDPDLPALVVWTPEDGAA